MIIYLMGPTASGKTPLAVEIVQRFPCEIISVDSAMIYREMDIGTAKPTPEILQIAPHRLINILDPSEIYSAGKFRTDALREINDIIQQGKIPLLVGGTMLYFRVLQQGLAQLPTADATVRAELAQRGEHEGWEKLHAELLRIDPDAAKRIHANDSQRIQRALEVYQLTGKTLTAWQAEGSTPSLFHTHSFALAPSQRVHLHERIALRFQQMLELGFIEEGERLFARGDLSTDLPAIRSVGYRQVWAYLSGEVDYATMCDQALAATRQLAKRQLTWLRSWPNVNWFDSEARDTREKIFRQIENINR
jgi:tRNA dimethylallyltransferase